MESTFHSIILGIIQGITEFLPISSSGHLEIAKFFLGDTSVAEQSMLMTVNLHLATALSTLLVFRKEVGSIIRGIFQKEWNAEKKFSLTIILSMIPAALVGIFMESEIAQLFDRRILLVSGMLSITGLLLLLADRAKITDKEVSYRDAIVIGIAQAIAILPGISRSGATISTSVLLGIDRERAARFSFLMVVPLILGKVAKDLLDGRITESSIHFLPFLSGFVAAFVTGALACIWMLRLVKASKLRYFSIYCWIVAAALAIYWVIAYSLSAA